MEQNNQFGKLLEDIRNMGYQPLFDIKTQSYCYVIPVRNGSEQFAAYNNITDWRFDSNTMVSDYLLTQHEISFEQRLVKLMKFYNGQLLSQMQENMAAEIGKIVENLKQETPGQVQEQKSVGSDDETDGLHDQLESMEMRIDQMDDQIRNTRKTLIEMYTKLYQMTQNVDIPPYLLNLKNNFGLLLQKNEVQILEEELEGMKFDSRYMMRFGDDLPTEDRSKDGTVTLINPGYYLAARDGFDPNRLDEMEILEKPLVTCYTYNSNTN